MNGLTDQQLLRDYTERHTEAAFGELVRRHVDLVYSAAVRMVRDPHVAEDVTQGVFVALSRSAGQLTERPVLSGWLHRTAQNIAANTVRSDVRRRAREQEAAAMNDLLAPESDASWEEIAPHLDSALSEMSEPDREALLLRYFERKSAREMAQTLRTSEEAAQKRVSRAVEHLRELLAKHGVTAGAGGLALLLSANAVQAAPTGLALSITASAALAGTAAATLSASAAKVVALTTLHKALIAATLVAAIGVGTYEARQASLLRAQVRTLQQQVTPPLAQTPNTALASFQNRVQSLEAENTQLVSALTRANADKTQLQTEREQARHAVALYKELVEQTSPTTTNPTNEYPTARHVWTAFGRLGRIGALSREEDSNASPEEKAALEAARVKALDDLPNLIKAAKSVAASGDAKWDLTSPSFLDAVSCLFYGALNLDEQQFSKVYGVLEKYQQQANQQGLSRANLGATNSTPESVAAFTRLVEQWKAETQTLLTSEQTRIFRDVLTNSFNVKPGNFSFNFGFSGQ